MPTFASSDRTRLVYVEEVTQGVCPGGPFTELPCTSRDINVQKNSLRSNQVDGNTRQRAALRHGFTSVAGNPAIEFSVAAFDDFLEGALGNDWATVTIDTSAQDVGINDSTNVIDRSAGDFAADGVRPGDFVTTAGFVNSANNGTFRVTAVSALTITIDPGTVTLVTEAATNGPLVTFPGKRLDIGNVLKTYSVERQFLDLTQFQLFKGVAVNTMTLSAQPESIITGGFDLIGMSADALEGTPEAALNTVVQAPGNAPFDAFDGDLYEGGSSLALVTGFDLSLSNNRRLPPVIGERNAPVVTEGRVDLTGTLSAFFQDATLVNKFINETESSLWIRFNDPNGTDWISIVLYRIKYTGGDLTTPEGEVNLNMPFEALENTTYQTSLSIQRSNT